MFDEVVNRLAALFSPEAIGAYLARTIPALTVAVITMTLFWLGWRLIARALRAVLGRSRVDATAASFIHTAVKVVLLAVGLVTALSQLGVDTTSLLTSLGVAGLTLGFAAKDALSNMISGFFIFWDRPFVIGDLVEIDGHYGRVESITLRSTRVVTPDGKMLAVPNATALNAVVASYTNFPHLRLDIDFTVAVTEDLGRVRRLLLDMVAADAAYMADPPAEVHVLALNDYNVALQLRVWIGDERQHVGLRTRTRESVFETLRAAGVEMPYETLALAPVDVVSRPAA